MKLDIFNLRKELNYLCDYYGSEFIPGLGTEEILYCFNKYFINNKWLDLGGGTTSLLWWMAQKYNNKIFMLDKSYEAYMLTKIIQKSNFQEGCFKYVNEKFYNKNLKKSRIKFIYGDILNSDLNINKKFSNINQIGLLGLCKNISHFKENLNKIIKLLKKNGVLISANWIFTNNYAKKKAIDNSYLNYNEINNTLKEFKNCEIKFIKYIQFNNDINYKGVIIYVLQKKE